MFNDIEILNRHKKNIICDVCRKQIWFFQKAVRFVAGTKDHIWAEYYHLKCLRKFGIIKKLDKTKKGKWDKDDEPSTTNVVH